MVSETDRRCWLLSQSTIVFVTYFERSDAVTGRKQTFVPRLELERFESSQLYTKFFIFFALFLFYKLFKELTKFIL